MRIHVAPQDEKLMKTQVYVQFVYFKLVEWGYNDEDNQPIGTMYNAYSNMQEKSNDY